MIALISGCKPKKAQLRIGDPPPAVTLSDLKGNKVNMPADFKGKVVVIRFWADWCPKCAEEMPVIDTIYKKYKDKGLVVLAVNTGQTKEKAEAFINNLNVSYPALLDTDTSIAKRYGVIGLPTTFIIDRSGAIKEKILGEADRNAFEKSVSGLL
jgi:peroxiredoxin